MAKTMKKKTIILLSLIITLASLYPYLLIRKGGVERDITKNKELASERLYDYSGKLIGTINQIFEHIEAIELIMHTNPDNLEIIQEYSKMVSKKHDTIKNIALAPNGIMEYIYPLEGNEGAMGHNLIEDTDREYFIKKNMDERIPVIQGPVEAVQGGILVFNRKAIFIKEDNIERFWGIIAISVDFEELMNDIGLDINDPDYLYRIKAEKSNGFEDYIWGNLGEETDFISNRINFKDQVWDLDIYPRGGWKDKEAIILNLEPIDIFYIILSLVLFIVLYNHLNQYRRHSIKAKLDAMTGTINRSTFLSLVNDNLYNKKDKIQGFIIMDINDFKHINDTYGHMVGDFVIIEFAKRLLNNHRNKDLVSRWGGDEFTIYLNDIDKESDIKDIIERIEKSIEEPFIIEDVYLNVEASLGYALYPNDGLEFGDLYKKADMMMYTNKPKKC